MSQLPSITSPRPVTIPAQPEKMYPNVFGIGINIAAKTDEQPIPFRTVIRYQPYNHETKELGPADFTRVEIDDARTLAAYLAQQGDNRLLQAFGALAQAVQAMAEREEFATPMATANVLDVKTTTDADTGEISIEVGTGSE